MKNQILILTRLVTIITLVILIYPCSNASAQEVSIYQFRYVPADKVDEFIKRETTYWSKVAQKAVKGKKLSFWGLFEKVGGAEDASHPNFLFINTYSNIDSTGDIWNASAVFPKVPMTQMEDYSFTTTLATYFLQSRGWEQAPGITEKKDFRYVLFNFHNSTDPESFVAGENKVWAPFIKTAMEKNQTTQKGWGNGVVLVPGYEAKFNSVSFDLYPTLTDLLMQKWDSQVVFPMDGLQELNKLRPTAPGREIYRVVMVVN